MSPRIRALVPLAALTCLLLTAAPASAIFIVTPLTLTPSQNEAEVGDEIVFDLGPNEEYDGETDHAGKPVRVQWGYDTSEPSENGTTDEPTSEEDNPYVYRDLANLTLDAQSRASFRWTVPEEVDDENVFVTVLSADGETLASAHIAVGDAEPIMMVMSGPAGGEPVEEGGEEPLMNGDGPADTSGGDAGEGAADDAARNTPAAGFVAAAAGLGLAAFALRRRG